MKAKILVVEDESIVAEDIKRSLQSMGYDVPAVVSTGKEAVKKAEELMPDLILMDIVLREKMNGIDAAGHIRSTLNIPIIYLTAYADDKTIERAKVTEPFGYIIKPFEDRELHSTIEMALYKHGMEVELKKSRKWLSTVLSSIGDAVIATDTKGNVFFMNPVAESLTGWKEDEAREKPLETVFHIIREDDETAIESPVEKVLREGVTVGLANHTLLINRDGTKVPIDDSGAPIKDEKGDIMGVVLVFHDITERRKTEKMLHEAKQDWEDTFNTITDMITVHDKDFNIIRANDNAREILGLPLLEPSPAKCFRYYHGTSSPPRDCPSCECLKTKESATFEYFEPHLNKFLEIRAMPRFDTGKQLIGLIHVVRDITERRKIEEEVKKAKIAWEMTFDNATELIVLVDKSLSVTRCNRSFAEFIQTPIKEVIGKKFTDIFSSASTHFPSDTADTRTEIETESGRWLYLSFCPVVDEQGEFLHSLIIGTDITEVKNFQLKLSRSESELKERVDELERFYETAVSREHKMIQLKREIKKLKEELSDCKR